MKKIYLACLLFLSACIPNASTPKLDLNVRKVKLPNGLTCLLVHRGDAPVFSGFLRMKVGNIEEDAGSSGLAHFFEHMAFKGTPAIGSKSYADEQKILEELHRVGTRIVEERHAGKTEGELAPLKKELADWETKHQQWIDQNEFVRIYQRNGGADMNATTNNDYTNYFVSLPTSKLELWAYMESERLLHPVYREFYKERDVVAEERRMRYDNDPDGRLYEAFLSASFDQSPYRIPVIGYAKEIQDYTYAKAKEFHDRYYIPQRMVLAVVGNFNMDEAEATVRKYFGRLPTAEDKPKTIAEEKPAQNFPRATTVTGEDEPRFYMGFKRPTFPHADDEVFDVISSLLCDGRSSRLFSHLVKEKRMAASVNCYSSVPGVRLDNLFAFSATPLSPHTNQDVQKEMLEKIEELKQKPVNPNELEKVRKQIDAALVWGLKENMELAESITFYESLTGDWKYVYDIQKKIHAVKPQDIQRVAQTYFTDDKRITAFLEKQ